MKMIRNAMIAVLVLTTCHLEAQPGDRMREHKEDIEAMKIGFLTRRLDLSPGEAKVFWPVYEQFQSEREALRDAMKDRRKQARDGFDEMSDAEVEKLVDSEIAFRQQELDLMKKYHEKFKSVLPVKKVAKLYRTEEDFKRELLQRLQHKDRDASRSRGRGRPVR